MLILIVFGSSLDFTYYQRKRSQGKSKSKVSVVVKNSNVIGWRCSGKRFRRLIFYLFFRFLILGDNNTANYQKRENYGGKLDYLSRIEI